MVRIFFTFILPLIRPFLLYMAWNAYAKYRARAGGGEEPSLEKAHIFWSLIAGFVLMAAILITLAITGGDSPDSGTYIPPRLEDGKIIPPTYEKDPAQ